MSRIEKWKQAQAEVEKMRPEPCVISLRTGGELTCSLALAVDSGEPFIRLGVWEIPLDAADKLCDWIKSVKE